MGTSSNRPPFRYRLYLDESGDHVYQNFDDPNSRFLAVVGIWVEQSNHYPAFAKAMVEFKKSIFGNAAGIVFHRKEILNKKGVFSRLGKDGVEAAFNAGWLKIISDAKYRCTCVVIDKQEHKKKYKRPFHPYHLALGAVLDRYCGWMRQKKGIGDIVAESRNPQENLALEAEYRRILAEGTLQFREPGWHKSVLSSTSIKFCNKKSNSPGLELTDSLAFPLRQWGMIQKQHIPDPGEVFGKEIVRACATRLHRCPNSGRIGGFGHVWLPRDEEHPEVTWPVQ